mgnify:CR=1 FL=1|tara:strand:- start:4112 stop:4615 length:504 start_codon:yes stop_codon:yes gene_type:complete
MSRAYRFLASALLCAWAGSVPAAVISTSNNGWHTWRIDEASARTEMCCYSIRNGSVNRSGCDLDGRGLSISDHGDCSAGPGQPQIYVRIKNGIPVDIRALSSTCPVSSEAKIADLGSFTADENLDWFRGVIENRGLKQHSREQALLALVMSESNAAFEYLDRLLTAR